MALSNGETVTTPGSILLYAASVTGMRILHMLVPHAPTACSCCMLIPYAPTSLQHEDRLPRGARQGTVPVAA
eukprot:2453696-Rhodomonas_salina.1